MLMSEMQQLAYFLHALNLFSYQHAMFKTLVSLILCWKEILGFRLHKLSSSVPHVCIKEYFILV